MSQLTPILNAFRSLCRLWSYLSALRKKQFFVLLVIMILGSLAEILSLGLVVPFLIAMAAPGKIISHLMECKTLVYLKKNRLIKFKSRFSAY